MSIRVSRQAPLPYLMCDLSPERIAGWIKIPSGLLNGLLDGVVQGGVNTILQSQLIHAVLPVRQEKRPGRQRLKRSHVDLMADGPVEDNLGLVIHPGSLPEKTLSPKGERRKRGKQAVENRIPPRIPRVTDKADVVPGNDVTDVGRQLRWSRGQVVKIHVVVFEWWRVHRMIGGGGKPERRDVRRNATGPQSVGVPHVPRGRPERHGLLKPVPLPRLVDVGV